MGIAYPVGEAFVARESSTVAGPVEIDAEAARAQGGQRLEYPPSAVYRPGTRQCQQAAPRPA